MKFKNPEEFILSTLEDFLKQKNILDLQPVLQKPKEENFGDFSTNLALQLAKPLRSKPSDIAGEIISFFPTPNEFLSKIEIAGPGFLNFFAAVSNIYDQFRSILKSAEHYGLSERNSGKTALIEFVSANPTGPLTIGHGRQAVLGDTLTRLLEATGYKVQREYYFNNAGRQMRILGESVRLRYLQLLGDTAEFPEDYYQGEYIRDIARDIKSEFGSALQDDKENPVFKDRAEQAIFEDIKKTVKRLGFTFDSFFNEKSLYDDHKIDAVVADLRNRGLVEERDGATWFLTTKMGFEQDRVIIKSSGEPTYRLPDIAYHADKVKRGYNLIVDIFGADHIATYPDVLAGLQALGLPTDQIKVLIHQFVTLTESGKIVKMSTRKANFVTLDELMDEVGVDVTRYFFLMRHMNAHLNFDLGLAKTQSDENPVFYIQYAHARICSIIALTIERGVNRQSDLQPELLNSNEELSLIKHLIQFPEIVHSAAEYFEPHRLINYLFELANLFHKFYTLCRVISDDQALTTARLALIDATRMVIANGLKLLGVTAPEKM